MSESLRKVLGQLCELYAAHGIVEKSGEFFQVGLYINVHGKILSITIV